MAYIGPSVTILRENMLESLNNIKDTNTEECLKKAWNEIENLLKMMESQDIEEMKFNCQAGVVLKLFVHIKTKCKRAYITTIVWPTFSDQPTP